MVRLAVEQITVPSNKRLCKCGCGEWIDVIDKKGIERFYKSGHNPTNWKGGRIKSSDGYWLVKKYSEHLRTSNNGYVREHILVFEETYNCCVLKYAIIHHINGDRLDNRPENLEGMTRLQHMRLHRTGKKYPKEWCRRISMALTGHKLSEETKRKIGLKSMGRNKGKHLGPLSEETKLKLREAALLQWQRQRQQRR